MVAGEEVSVDMITFFLLRDIPSTSYKRRLRLHERNGNNRRASRAHQPKFHGGSSILRSLYFLAMPPHCSIPNTGSKQAELGVIGGRHFGRPKAVNGPKNHRKRRKYLFS